MASGDQESLRALEALMNEFFAPTTTNERKRGIEEVLNNFSQQRDAWKHCLFFISETRNEYVMMYAMSVLETLINKQWIGLQGQDRMEIRSSLNRFLLTHCLPQQEQVPKFVRNKLVKLVVDIGRLDWPHFYPDFFSSILSLVQQPSMASLGLVLLQTTSEELACPREDLSVARKEELHRLLLQQVPTVLQLINNILESILDKHQQLVTATPPPSPTHGQPHESPHHHHHSRSPMSLFSSSPAHTGNLLSNMFKSPQSRVQTEAIIPLDSSSHHLSSQALSCLSHLFSWIPLSSTITPALLSTVFHFAAFGCDTTPTTGGSANTSIVPSLGVQAMCCINELLAKNCVPAEFEDFLLQMFQQTFYLLQRITRESNTNSSGNRLEQLDEDYVEKFTEFLRLFVSIHLRRFEGNSQFPVLEFLALLFKYTFKQPTHEGFYHCLDIWTVFLDYLNTKLEARNTNADSVISRYKEALVSLVTQILQKFQFRSNQSQLEELDDETLDDDCETEWQHFLRQCLETVAKVADLMPADTFQILYEPFHECLEIYLGLDQFVTNGHQQTRHLTINGENECRRLHCTLRDLSSLLQALGRLSHHFIGEHFMARFNEGHTLVSRFVCASSYGTKTRLYEVNSEAANILQGDFVEVHAQALAAVKAYSPWLAQFYVESQQHEKQRQDCASLINTLIDTLVPLFSKDAPEKVVHSAAHLLYSVMTTIRPSYLLQISSVQTLYTEISCGVISQLSLEIQSLVYRSLSHYLLLPWPGVTDAEQDWAMRAANHNSFTKQLTADYIRLKEVSALAENKHLQETAKPVVKKTQRVLTDLVESIAVQGVSKSKQMCYESLGDSIQVTLAIFPVYIHQPDVIDDMLGYFLALFRGVRVQMGVAFTEQILQTFMSLFTRDQLAETIMHESVVGHKVIEKFLSILEVIVQEPGAAFKPFLPNIISMCMEQIYPIIAERPSPDIKPTLYELLWQLLQNNWRYFFKGSVKTALQSPNDVIENEQQFISMMQAFGQSFLQPDIAIFRQNLEALENLNSKWKLYHKRIFCEVMLSQFLTVLIQVLVHKSHDLLQEEIGITVYNMASVDFNAFYSSFLPQFLSSCEGVDENQKTILGKNFKMDNDLPSFTQSIHRFVNDLRYYRLCNSSLPEGSIKF